MALVAAAVAMLAACKHDIQNIGAVRESVVGHLKEHQSETGLNVDSMKVEVLNLTFSSGGGEAHATVKFTPKAGGSGMQIPYTLDRKGDQWVVRGHAEGGQNPHGASEVPAMPQGHPPVDQQP